MNQIGDHFLEDKFDVHPQAPKFIPEQRVAITEIFEQDHEIIVPVSEKDALLERIKELESEIEKARREGFVEGYEKCKVDLNAEFENYKQELYERLTSIIEDSQKQLDIFKETLEAEFVKASVMLAEKLLLYGVKFNPLYIEEFLKEVLKAQKIAQVTRIHLSPDDYENLISIKLHSSKKFQGIEFIQDPTVRAGCIVETTSGGISMLPFEKLEEIKDKLFT